MLELRTHGDAPYTVAVVHGGPGAPGSVAPVARALADRWGVLEPFQTAATLEGQAHELRGVLAAHGAVPVALVGWSWGALLSFITAARYPELVKRLILVSSGVFDARYAPQIMQTRLSRLADAERDELARLQQVLDADYGTVAARDAALARIGELFKTCSDSYDLLPEQDDASEGVSSGMQLAIHRRVWDDAEALRARGDLIELGRRIQCPVVVLHGDHDPHPLEGVRAPLTQVVPGLRVHLLERCGHYPWLERHARDAFFELLRAELES